MSRGHAFFDTQLVGTLTMSGTGTVASPVTILTSWPGVAYDCRWPTGVTGALQVQVSLDNLVWYNTNAQITAQPGGAATGVWINNVGIVGKYLRVSYTNTSGSGALSVYVFARETGV